MDVQEQSEEASPAPEAAARPRRRVWAILAHAAAVALFVAHFCFLVSHFVTAISSPDANGYMAQANLLSATGRSYYDLESPLQYVGIHWLRAEEGAGAEAAEWVNKTLAEPGEKEAYARMQQLGMKVVEPTNAQSWSVAMEPLWKETTARFAGSDVLLNWKDVTASDLRHYSIYRRTESGVTPVPANFLDSANDTIRASPA